VAGGCGVVEWGGKGPSLPAQVKGVNFLWKCEHRDGLVKVPVIPRASLEKRKGVRPCSFRTHIQGKR